MRATEDERPWYYRWRFTNWLMAAPWHWRLDRIYAMFRKGPTDTWGNVCGPGHGRLRSAWLALTFPHVHHESEEE